MFFERGHVWPLWENGSDEHAMDPSDYDYPPTLTDVLRQWQRAWAPIADFDMGETDHQRCVEAFNRYEHLARAGLARIRAETPPEVAVSIEMHDVPRPDVPDGFVPRRSHGTSAVADAEL